MTRFDVDVTAVAQAGVQARGSAAAITAEVSNMMRHLITLESSWHGQAASAFTQVTAQWRATQAQVEANLEQIATALDQAAAQYRETEQGATRLFTS